MALTDIKIRNAKPRDKRYKISDEKGLVLIIHPNGSKYWNLRYEINNKEKPLSLGTYPEVSLAEAREKRDAARKLLKEGINPQLNKQRKKHEMVIATENNFEAVARSWHEKFSKGWGEKYRNKVLRLFELHVFPWLGKCSINDMTSQDISLILEPLEKNDKIETAHRVRSKCDEVFEYARAKGLTKSNPAQDVRKSLPPVVTKRHHPTITDPDGIGKLLRTIETYQGYIVVKYALKLAPLVFVRPKELRFAEWRQINLDTATWRIPAKIMKMDEDHIVPLSTQAIAILKELHYISGNGIYLFPGVQSKTRHISDGTINSALRLLGYDTKEEFTGHGFRSMASTVLNEMNLWRSDAIERQLAHAPRNKIRATYNYAQYLPERREMMQWWADYLDKLKTNKT